MRGASSSPAPRTAGPPRGRDVRRLLRREVPLTRRRAAPHTRRTRRHSLPAQQGPHRGAHGAALGAAGAHASPHGAVLQLPHTTARAPAHCPRTHSPHALRHAMHTHHRRRSVRLASDSAIRDLAKGQRPSSTSRTCLGAGATVVARPCRCLRRAQAVRVAVWTPSSGWMRPCRRSSLAATAARAAVAATTTIGGVACSALRNASRTGSALIKVGRMGRCDKAEVCGGSAGHWAGAGVGHSCQRRRRVCEPLRQSSLHPMSAAGTAVFSLRQPCSDSRKTTHHARRHLDVNVLESPMARDALRKSLRSGGASASNNNSADCELQYGTAVVSPANTHDLISSHKRSC